MYFFDLNYSRMLVNTAGSELERVPVDDLSDDEQLHLAEMHFIWLLKPRYNTHYKDDIPGTSVYVMRAEALGYAGCYAEMELEGQMGFVAGPDRELCRGQRTVRQWRPQEPAQVVARLPNGTLLPMSAWRRLQGL